MKSIILISIICITIVYLIVRHQWEKRQKAKKLLLKEASRDQRTVEEIFEGRSYDEIYAELDSKEYEDLSTNELEALLSITLSYEHNHGRLPSKAEDKT